MSTALVPYQEERRSGSLVRYLGGGLGVDIRLSQGRKGAVTYSMRLASHKAAVTLRLYGLEKDGTICDLGMIDVEPFSVGSAIVPLQGRERRRYESVYLELIGDDVNLVVEAPKPAEPASRPRSLVFTLTTAGLAAATAIAVGFELPQPPAFSVPSTAAAGATVRLPYVTHGIASWSYAASLDDGSSVAAGPLKQSKGEITLALQPGFANKVVTVHLRGGTPLGVLDREASFAVTPPPPTRSGSIARIGAFTARRERFGDVDTVLASYLAVANSGQLSLLDQHGKVVARVPFSHGGTERITIPSSAASSALTARLDVRLGSTVARASVGLGAGSLATVAAQPGVAPVPAAPPPIADAPPTQDEAPEGATPADDRSTAAQDPFVVVGNPVAGGPIRLAIRGAFPGMQLRLEDDAGTVIDEVSVGANATAVTLHAPAATVVRTYYITCTYGSKNGQEVVVRSVRVSAR